MSAPALCPLFSSPLLLSFVAAVCGCCRVHSRGLDVPARDVPLGTRAIRIGSAPRIGNSSTACANAEHEILDTARTCGPKRRRARWEREKGAKCGPRWGGNDSPERQGLTPHGAAFWRALLVRVKKWGAGEGSARAGCKAQ